MIPQDWMLAHPRLAAIINSFTDMTMEEWLGAIVTQIIFLWFFICIETACRGDLERRVKRLESERR